MEVTSPSPTLLATPKSASRSASRRTRRLFPHLVEDSPQGKITPGSSIISPKSKTKKQLPSKFCQEMPRRSAEFENNNCQANASPIKKSTFYGSSSYVPRYLMKENEPLSTSLNEKLNLKTPPQKKKVEKKKKSTSASKNGVKKFGINKGVSHSIKKPKIKKTQEKPKSGTESASSDQEEIVKKSKTPKTPKMTTLIRQVYTTPETGKIAMTSDRSVGFEIKNGQMAFSYRRSPRRKSTLSPYFNKTRTPSADPKTPKALFTPSSKTDFINDWQPSPPKSGRRGRQNLPSPVKFHQEEDKEIAEYDSDGQENAVNGIIDNLAVTISDAEAELERIAAQTTTEVFQQEQLGLEISTILANITSPTKEDREERRENNLQLELDDSSNDAFDVTPKKNYSIFDKKPTRKSPRKALKEVVANQDNNKTNIRNKNKKILDDDQMIIDAGQKKLTDLKTCLECGFVYNPGNKQDEEAHNKNHFVAQKGINFSGWKNECNMGTFPEENSRIIKVTPKDHASHWAKVNDVLTVVDKQLGIVSGDSVSRALRNKDESRVYLYISSNKIVGLLLAETIDENDNIEWAVPDKSNAGGAPKLEKRKENSPRVFVGISRIWIANDFRRQGVATKMVQALRIDIKGQDISQCVAFSHTTPDGTMFASKIFNKGGPFLTYNPNSRQN